MRKPAKSEDGLLDEVLDFFTSKLASSEFQQSVEISVRQPVLTDVTVRRDKGRGNWQYYFDLKKHDVVFHLRGKRSGIPLLDGPLATYSPLQNVSAGSQSIVIPLLICELSLRWNVTDHQLTSYSRIASRIHDIHPYCGYYLVVGGPETSVFRPDYVLTQAKGFDRVFLDWERQSETIWNDVVNHLDYLRLRAGLIGGEDVA